MILVFVIATFALTIINFTRQEFSMSHLGAAFDELIANLNANTNATAAEFDKLHAELAAAADAGDPITQAQLDSLSKINDHLKALGADERAPLPPVPVVVAPPAPAPVPESAPSV